jgi:glycosyltransferase involved in cell wall biosynthesis
MKILLPVMSFQYLTGSEMYVYELGRELVRRGHEVTVAAHRVEGAMAEPALAAGLQKYRFQDFPDGQSFDVVHASQSEPTRWAMMKFPNTPVICSVHSQYPVERPMPSPRVLHYICVRPEVQAKITSADRVPLAKTSVIYNPVDFARFHNGLGQRDARQKRRVLFCGTIAALRKPSILDLIARSQAENFELRLVGLKADNYDGYIDRLPTSVNWFDQIWNVEHHIQRCDETAGILLGRTTIEGWACGKPGWIYDIDLKGNILGSALHQPPADMERFDSNKVTDQIEALYVRYCRS